MDKGTFYPLRARVLHIFNALCWYLRDALSSHGQRGQAARPGCHRCSSEPELSFGCRAPSFSASPCFFYRTHHFAKSGGSEGGPGAHAATNPRRDLSTPAESQAATLAYAHSHAYTYTYTRSSVVAIPPTRSSGWRRAGRTRSALLATPTN